MPATAIASRLGPAPRVHVSDLPASVLDQRPTVGFLTGDVQCGTRTILADTALGQRSQ